MKYLVLAVSLFMSMIGTASAALNAAVTGAFTEVQTDGMALIDLAWPVVIALTVAIIMIGLFKKVAKKAAS